MASYDLRRILSGWEHEPGQITVRKVAGDDGSVKIQMRLDLGLLQMETSGRPDGQQPLGCESLLDHHESQLDTYKERNGTDLGFELTPEDCHALREEAVQYYHRYLSEFVLEDFEGVERDTGRNLRLLDLTGLYAREDGDRIAFEQYRPYLIMMNTRAQVHLSLRKGRFKTALARVEAGLSMITQVLSAAGQEEDLEDMTEVSILSTLRREIAARMPADPVQKLEDELERAVEEDRFEDAIVLRKRVEAMRSKKAATRSRRRRR